VVINTDACCILDESNRKLLSNELTIYLKTKTSDQVEKTSLNQPPLINQDASDFFDALHKDRDKLYEDASVVIDTCVGNFSDHISDILVQLQAKGINTQ
jgi:shikimate kinase